MRYAAATLVATLAPLAVAAEITQSVNIAIDDAQGQFGQNVTFDRFDTMGGTRELTGVIINYEADLFLEATAQSFFDQPITAGSWSADVFHNVLFAFNDPNDGDGGDGDGDGDGRPTPAPFYGLGGIAVQGFTGDLGPGVPGSGGPFDPGIPGDPITTETAGSIDSTVGTSSGFFDFFNGLGTIDGFIGPFTETLVTPPPAGQIGVFASRLTQSGTLSVTYTFDVVPTPGTAAVVGLAGLAAVRRRR